MLRRGSFKKMKFDFVKIKNPLSGGKTGAVTFVVCFGVLDKTTFIRVLKNATKDICELENEGYAKKRE